MKTAKLMRFPQLLRLYSIHSKVSITPNEKILNNIEESVYKPRKHPGIINIKTVEVPSAIVSAIQNVTQDFPLKKIIKDAVELSNHLQNRTTPMEQDQIENLRDEIYTNIYKKEQKRLKDQFDIVKDEPKFTQSIKDRVIQTLKEKVYNWKPLNYNAYNSLVYLMARFPLEYAVMSKIFAEIKQRDEGFKPKSFFDFGSGTGSAMWACNQYYGKLFEYFNVDSSAFMNELSLSLMNDGRGNKQGKKNVFYRQFLPSTNNLYDIVVSSYSLMELPSFETRMETILNLWNKTGRYLIIVENGTNAGFRVISQARDYLLQVSASHAQSRGFVFSPCPHDLSCPRYAQDRTPCNFPIQYYTLPLGAKSAIKKDLYCYVVLRKGTRTLEQTKMSDELDWPRLVRETLLRHKHAVCRMCTKHGALDEVVFTAKKHGKSTYQCARATKWGDRLPVDVGELENGDAEDNEHGYDINKE